VTCATGLPERYVTCGRVPIDATFGTAGLSCTAAALLPGQVGVGDHWVFLVDIASEATLGNVFL
jgi:hypothetical protein